MSMLLLDRTTSRFSPVSRSMRSILSVRASHQYSFPSCQPEHPPHTRSFLHLVSYPSALLPLYSYFWVTPPFLDGRSLLGWWAGSETPMTPLGAKQGSIQRNSKGRRGQDKGNILPWALPKHGPFTQGDLCSNLVVHRNAIGPADADVDQNCTLRAIQSRSLDAWILAPLGPEQVPVDTGGTGLSFQIMKNRTPQCCGLSN